MNTALSTQLPILPDYATGCIRALVPELLVPGRGPAWLPAGDGHDPVVLLVIDGLGWEQLQDRLCLAPALASMSGGPIRSVVPTTTATALTSITTGLTPGEHGVVGYRMLLGGDVVNSLRWSTGRGDARALHPPAEVQPFAPFLGEGVVVCTRREFNGSGFTEAHLRKVTNIGWHQPSNLPVQVAGAVRGGAKFVYAYYDGVDHVAHEYGFGEHYDAELEATDRLIADLIMRLPSGTRLVVTADHGQVDVGGRTIRLDPSVTRLCTVLSGEGRFRWLHARPGASGELLEAATQRYGDVAWVVGRDTVIDDGWLGPTVSGPVARRLGDVALVAREPVTFDDPAEKTAIELVCRHGSLTSAEMLVPRLVTRV